jgi:hypothetical protein
MKNLIGRKVKGFWFDYTSGLNYDHKMDKHIGEIGEIKTYNNDTGAFGVEFKDDYWYYPADQIEAHLVDEWLIGEEYEFSDCEPFSTWEKGKLLGIVDHKYKYITLLDGEDYPYSRLKIRPIESNREVKEQIAKFERELAELKQLINK